MDIHKITVGMVLERLEGQGSENFALAENIDTQKIETLLANISTNLHSNDGAKLIMEL
jgi:hypothetical protein